MGSVVCVLLQVSLSAKFAACAECELRTADHRQSALQSMAWAIITLPRSELVPLSSMAIRRIEQWMDMRRQADEKGMFPVNGSVALSFFSSSSFACILVAEFKHKLCFERTVEGKWEGRGERK